ncbi:hypothetical protein BJ165DRAFT_1490205 [Panaeolus papilionaceus]|nr:hypothetical protein BJ165DRAFT_1490205 [Panaeolus papilionaceus]
MSEHENYSRERPTSLQSTAGAASESSPLPLTISTILTPTTLQQHSSHTTQCTPGSITTLSVSSRSLKTAPIIPRETLNNCSEIQSATITPIQSRTSTSSMAPVTAITGRSSDSDFLLLVTFSAVAIGISLLALLAVIVKWKPWRWCSHQEDEGMCPDFKRLST